VWIVLGVALTLLLRAPWFDAALGRDEAGVALVARHWHGGASFAYGTWFLDRPPLLLTLYRLAGDSQVGIRVLGAVAASVLVVLTTLLAVRLGGRRAAPWAAGISAVAASSFALRAVFTPAELLAVVPSCASVLLLVIAIEKKRLWTFAAAGALAAAALLVKQSFGDALAAGLVALVAGRFLGVSWRESWRRAGAYGAGLAAVAAALSLWAWATNTSAHSIWYAMFGFRLDAVSALSGSGLEGRLSKLESPFLDSGLAIAIVLAVVGIARLRDRPVVRIALVAWLAAAVVGIVLGGSYWPHYLIALIPATAAGAAWTLARFPRWLAVLAVCAIAASTALSAVTDARHDPRGQSQPSAVEIGHYLRSRALPGQTAYVLYAKVNILYYAGLRDPFPYNWSLMMRAVPGAESRLRQLLASPGRPTWVVKADRTRAFRLDRNGATGRLLTAHYRRAGTVCGFHILLARGASAAPAPPPVACGSASSAPAPPT
jgi:4-amino-4-deoxy-L-arabinose transferase-like glycosyltransferase